MLAPAPPAGAGDRDARGASSSRLSPAGYEKRVLQLTNARREAHGCRPLRANAALRTAAGRHSQRMANFGFRQNVWNSSPGYHQLPGEQDLGTRVTRAGYRNWTGVAENIAYNYPTPRDVVRGWMNSSGHRANILNCSFRHLGVGYVKREGEHWWTQNFGRR